LLHRDDVVGLALQLDRDRSQLGPLGIAGLGIWLLVGVAVVLERAAEKVVHAPSLLLFGLDDRGEQVALERGVHGL
jgi:hypothetical protein